eukprot:c12294_g1_i1 orf=82-1398(+)
MRFVTRAAHMETMSCTCTTAQGLISRQASSSKPCADPSRKWPSSFKPRPSRRHNARSVQVECTAQTLKQVKPLDASELQRKFGSEGLQFSDVAGMIVLELKLNTGTAVRLLLHEGRVTSYKCRLWHGSVEEFLHTDVSESAPNKSAEDTNGDTSRSPVEPLAPPQNLFIIGGMASSLADSLPPHLPLFEDNWIVESVQVNPDEQIQVTLRCIDEGRGSWQFLLQNVITLTNRYLAFAVVVTNNDKKPMMFTGSVSTQLAIRATEAICCVGLQGCKYYSPSLAAQKAAQSNSMVHSLAGTFRRFMQPFQLGESKEKDTADNIVVPMKGTNEMLEKSASHSYQEPTNWFMEKPKALVSLTNGVHKVYSNAPQQVRITDQGFRRSLLFESHGFENLEVSSPDSDGDRPFVSIGCSSILSPVTLDPKNTWRGVQVLIPDTKL